MKIRHIPRTKTFRFFCYFFMVVYLSSCMSTRLITDAAPLEKCDDISKVKGVKLTSGEVLKFENKEGKDSLVSINKDGLIYKDPMGKKIKLDKEDIAGVYKSEFNLVGTILLSIVTMIAAFLAWVVIAFSGMGSMNI